MADIQIFETSQVLYHKAADLFLRTAEKVLRDQGRFSVALSGGSTPLPLYRRLAEDQPGESLDWHLVDFFWGDERAVAPDHPDSNFRAASQALLDPRSIPAGQIHRIRGELHPERAARIYQEELLGWFQDRPPRFDLILLGLGSDGHTASLFPGTVSSPADRSSWVKAVYIPTLESWRITFTARLINAASLVLFLVSGKEKARALNRVINGSFQPDTFPAQLIQPTQGQLTWLIDKAAAAELGS